MGAKEDGKQILDPTTSVERRVKTMKRRHLRYCCGSTKTGHPACVSTFATDGSRKTRCGCARSEKGTPALLCGDRCGCDPDWCQNRIGGEKAQQERAAAAAAFGEVSAGSRLAASEHRDNRMNVVGLNHEHGEHCDGS